MKQQIQNRTLFINDNLNVLRGMNSESVDLIYIDPPFNSNKHYKAPVGSKAAGAEFNDAWHLDDVEQEWVDSIASQNKALYRLLETVGTMGTERTANGNKGYLQYMSVRLLEMHRILKETGSMYLHCDDAMSHYLKLVMDCIFDKDNFRNEVIWYYGERQMLGVKQYNRKNDIILFYTKSDKYTFRLPREEHKEKYINAFFKKGYCKDCDREFKWNNKAECVECSGTMVRFRDRGKGNTYPDGRQYLDEEGRGADTVWQTFKPMHSASMKHKSTGYPTEKPVALLERIIQASSNEGDVVLDAFCGCATTLVASEKHNRQWIGIDIAPKAIELVNDRMTKLSKEAENNMFEWGKGKYQAIIRESKDDIPVRTDLEKIVIDKSIKNKLYKEQEGICNGCDTHFMARNLEIDHKTPRSKGGGDNIENLQLLCGFCNRVKGDRDMHYLKVQVKETQKGFRY